MSTNGVAPSVLPNVLVKSANNLDKQELANALMPVDSIRSGYGLWVVLGGVALLVALIALGIAVYSHYSSSADSPWWSDRSQTEGSLSDELFRKSGSATGEAPAPVPASASASASVSASASASASTPSPVHASTAVQTPSAEILSKAKARAAHDEIKKSESWCLVGEDLEGRWCVKVPSRDSCDANRVFHSRSECELNPANALPSGVVNQGGTGMTPLSSRPTGSR